ncbi:GxxExxY protein [Vreelandella alkaliphila]|uniref:GxxExxY protein n=1 Tax=Vreelandella alkaliphila TaxID=272774 RepID=A0AAJ2RQY2_9GAMM|nr:GxxExxY protein [Halomonas alkaliphila]MDX5976698.1 GxxExxY protein [Halomonas alkaliphila]
MLKEEALTYQIRGAVFEVSKQLGPGFLESIYQRALAIELRSIGLEVETEKPVNIYYKQCLVGEHRLDVLVENRVILELKAQSQLPASAEPQLINYLRATGLQVGLLINFSFPKTFIKRIVV